MRNGLKTALFVSAFSPALISVGAARLWAHGLSWDAIYYILAGLFGSLSVVYIMASLKWLGESFPFQAKKIEANDGLLFGVVGTYIAPFFGKASDITLGVVVILFLIAFLVSYLVGSILPSPLMRLLSFRFYKAESSNGVVYTLITNRELLDPGSVKIVKKISSSMLLEIV
ncbi:hypothetical protein [Beijerinckia sp. L45]|uniref:hypothetical protein n=1 Tax=Beijerinckia sp. L45 TaxID=1641855 RepID=UPI00131B43AF|nr:hypothetical protein [Beijerinckia sp. L45]